VLVSQPGAVAKRLGHPAQRRCQPLGALPGNTRGALGVALALGGLALGCRLVSSISGFLARLALLEPGQARPRPIPNGLLTLNGHTLALIRRLFALVGGPLTLVGDPLTLIRDPLTLIGVLLALIRYSLPLVGHSRRPSDSRGLRPR
jgi:hypothetical protein